LLLFLVEGGGWTENSGSQNSYIQRIHATNHQNTPVQGGRLGRVLGPWDTSHATLLP